MHANSKCISCIRTKQQKAVRHLEDEAQRERYLREVERILQEDGKTQSSPWLAEKIGRMQREFWDDTAEYAKIKHQFNQLLLRQEPALEARIRQASDPIEACIRYVCAANYIDFSAVEHVTEDALDAILEKAAAEQVPAEEYALFRRDLDHARQLVYLTDNCGEIVMDKLFLRFLKEAYPALSMTAMVRGEPTINDATMEDAREVGLTEVVPCIGSGSGCPGTDLSRLSSEARAVLEAADVVISKGQGNFEALYGEGVNPYYLFLCKCDLFVRRFGLEQFSSVFRREERLQLAEQVE